MVLAMSTHEKLLAEVEAFLDATGMKATNFGLWGMNDRMFVFKLRKGRIPSVATMDRVQAFMRANRPRRRRRPKAQAAELAAA